MMIIFFILNSIIFLAVCLATSMFDNHLKNISHSIDIFLDPKAYKPESQMKFISSILDKYKKYESELAMKRGIDALIDDSFYSEKIGIFNLSTIYTVAKEGKQLLWASMGLMVVFEAVTIGLGKSMIHSLLIIMSGGLGLVLVFSQLYINVDLEKESLVAKIKNYLNHTYPHLKWKQKEQKQVSLLINKISKLEDEIEKNEQIEQTNQQNVKEGKIDLVEEDIIQLIEHFV